MPKDFRDIMSISIKISRKTSARKRFLVHCVCARKPGKWITNNFERSLNCNRPPLFSSDISICHPHPSIFTFPSIYTLAASSATNFFYNIISHLFNKTILIPTTMANEPAKAPKSNEKVVAEFQALRNEQRNLVNNIATLEMDLKEHK